MLSLASRKTRCRRLPRRAALIFRFTRDDRASIALMFALMLPVLFGIVGLGVEVGIWFKERRELQTIADAAAVSAAIENTFGATQAELEAAAALEAANNGFDDETDAISYVGTPTTGAYAGDSGYIEVIVSRQLETILSQVFYALDPSTSARAVASTVADQEACVLALSPSAQNAVWVTGAGTSVSMDGCSMVANSDDPTKAINVQNGSLDIDCLWTAGGISGSENITTDCASPVEGAAQVDDPFADLDVPAFAGCDQDPPGGQRYKPADGEVLSEGVYCGGIEISSGNAVTMAEGIYVIDEGDFIVNGGGVITSTGNGVTIILTASDGSGYGSITINGGATVELTAQTGEDTTGTITGDYTGILFYQDRDAGSSPTLNANFTGGSTMELAGAIYLPNNEMSFNGGNATDGNGCLMLVAQTVKFSGDADIENQCDMFGGNPVVYGAKPGLVE